MGDVKSIIDICTRILNTNLYICGHTFSLTSVIICTSLMFILLYFIFKFFDN